MELIKVIDGDYAQYEELLLKRDELEKEAELILLEYTRVFGDITTEIFELKVNCIVLKKAISFCVIAKNTGNVVDKDALTKFIVVQMAVYQEELDEMVRKNELSKSSSKISAYAEKEIKRIYRKLAKLLHPDISNLTKEYPVFEELFQRILIAYQCNNYKELKELEFLTNRALEELGEQNFEVVIDNIEEKIESLRGDIYTIKNSIPYIYKELLENAKKMEEKMKEFEDERETYRSYKEELEKTLEELKES